MSNMCSNERGGQDDDSRGRTAHSRPHGHVVVNGLDVHAVVDDHLIDGSCCRSWSGWSTRPCRRRRTYVFLAAPPGDGQVDAGRTPPRARAGTSTSTRRASTASTTRSAYLDSHHVDAGDGSPLAHGQGCAGDLRRWPRSDDASRPRAHHDVAWPGYDRRLHDVVRASAPVTAGAGPGRGQLAAPRRAGMGRPVGFSAYNIFIDADPALLRDRLIDRKVRGGLDRPTRPSPSTSAATGLNVDRVLTRTDRSKVDLLLHLNPDGTIRTKGLTVTQLASDTSRRRPRRATARGSRRSAAS